MKGGALCPLCNCLLGPEFWNSGQFQTCPACSSQVMVKAFPAITTLSGSSSIVPCASGESSCFFHSDNRAETICDECGRFLCGLCSIRFGQRKFCPDCIYRKRRQKGDPLLIDQAILFDNIATTILMLSILTLSYLLLGLVVGLFTVCLVFVGWKYQRTLVQRSRFRFGIALILGLIGAVGWILLLLLVVQALPRYA
jgi:prepilin signal peptidase PulO-like enzyme (type II secretory pathway)